MEDDGLSDGEEVGADGRRLGSAVGKTDGWTVGDIEVGLRDGEKVGRVVG